MRKTNAIRPQRRILLHGIHINDVVKQEYIFRVQDGSCQPEWMLDLDNFNTEATEYITDNVFENNFD